MAVAGEGMSPQSGTITPSSKKKQETNTNCGPELSKRSSYQYDQGVMKPLPGKQPPSRTGFLVSFLVDARGGAMTGHRHWGMRVIIPPGALHQPTRVNCKYQMIQALASPPPLNEREALASRVIEISPAGEKFSAPVLLEIPHFASHARAERETVVLRSDDGITWREHISEPVEDGQIYQDVVESVVLDNSHLERIYDVLEVNRGRVVRILTSHFPKYFAVISRVREDSVTIGQEGGKVTLLQDTKLRATFPKNALNRPVKVGLQVQSLRPELVQAAYGRSVEVSNMVSVEPRCRKFHQPIFVSIPLPCAARNANNVRLLCSITGDDRKAQWQDMTGTTPLEINQDIVHFSTKVSAIFWILVIYDMQRDPESALSLASRLYEESILSPYMARISVFYRENFPRAWVTTLRIYCMTDDKAEKVITSLHGFQPLAFSGDIEITDTSAIAVKMKGNLLQLRQDPFNGEMLTITTLRSPDIKGNFIFKAFEENSLTLLVKPKEVSTPIAGKISFFRKLTAINDTQQIPICELNFNAKEGVIGGENKVGNENDEPRTENANRHVEAIKSSLTPINENLEATEHFELSPKPKVSKKDLEEDPYEIIERKTLADIHPPNDLENDTHTIVSTEEGKALEDASKENEPVIEVPEQEEPDSKDNALIETNESKEENIDKNDNLKRFETMKIEPMNKVDQHEQLTKDCVGKDRKTLHEFKKEFYVSGDGVANTSESPEMKMECKIMTPPDTATNIKHTEEQSGLKNVDGNIVHPEEKPSSTGMDDNLNSPKQLQHDSTDQKNIPIKVQKEKKKSFIQEWKNDLKDFFTIKKKSKNKTAQKNKDSDIKYQEHPTSAHEAAMAMEPSYAKEQPKDISSPSNNEAPTSKLVSEDSTNKFILHTDLEPHHCLTSMVAHRLTPFETEEPCLDSEINITNSMQNDIETLVIIPQKKAESMSQEKIDNIGLVSFEITEAGLESEKNITNSIENEIEKDVILLQENKENRSQEKIDNIELTSFETTGANLESEINITESIEDEIEKEVIVSQENKENTSQEKLETFNDTELSKQHEDTLKDTYTTGTNLESKINITKSIEDEIEKEAIVSQENKENTSQEKLETFNDTELSEQHEDTLKVTHTPCITTSMVTHCIIENEEVMHTPLRTDSLSSRENVKVPSQSPHLENNQSGKESLTLTTEDNQSQSYDWFKNKMLEIDENTGKYVLPPEPKGTTENWISNWIINEKEPPKKKENKSGFLKDVKKFFRPQKKSKMTNSDVSHSQTLQPSHDTYLTKNKSAQSLPTTPEVPQKNLKLEISVSQNPAPEPQKTPIQEISASQNQAPEPQKISKQEISISQNPTAECGTKQMPQDSLMQSDVPKVHPESVQDSLIQSDVQKEHPVSVQDSLIQYDVQKVHPVSVVDDLISNMLQEPHPTQGDDIKMDLSGESDDKDGDKKQYGGDSNKEQEDQPVSRQRTKKRSSRRKTNDTVTTDKTNDTVTSNQKNSNNENDQVSTKEIDQKSQPLEEPIGQGEEMQTNPPPEITHTRRKKKRKTNEAIEKEKERKLLYPKENSKKVDTTTTKSVLKKQDSTSSCGEKPKVVVAAPRGIPRPRRRKKDGTLESEYSRDASVDSCTEKNIEGIIAKRRSRQSSIVEIEELDHSIGGKPLTEASSSPKDSEECNPFCENVLVASKQSFLDEFIDKSIDEAIKCSIATNGELHKASNPFEYNDRKNCAEENIDNDSQDIDNKSQNIQISSAGESIHSLEANSKLIMSSEEFNRAADSFEELFLDEERRDSTKEVIDKNMELKSNLLGNITYFNEENGEKLLNEINTPQDDQNCMIDPEYLKNIDGQAHQRKGFTRFQKRQSSKDKHKSTSHEEDDHSVAIHTGEEEENMNLSTKLEETNVQMKRVDEAFTILSEDGDVDNIIIRQTITTETVREEPWQDQMQSNAVNTTTSIGTLPLENSALVQVLENSALDNSSSKKEMD